MTQIPICVICEDVYKRQPQRRPEAVGLEELAALVEALPGFQDDPAPAAEQFLLDILTVWYEEAT